MKKYCRQFVSAILSLLLLLSVAVNAYAQQTEVQPVVPISKSVVVSELLSVPGFLPDDPLDYETSFADVVKALREGFVARQEVITVPFMTTEHEEQLLYDVLNAALAHTGVPTEGDYLRWQIGECHMDLGGYVVGTDYYLTLSYTPQYYTTAAQEEEMDIAVEALLDALDVYDATDYEKVCAIYDYICANVTYDYEGLEAQESNLIYTAYAALINGTSVCQGYANLFYRLALELGVDARFVGGVSRGGGHGWNIVKLDGKYYNLDATWDASRAENGMPYEYFLRNQENFDEHTRDPEYLSTEFLSAYPMAENEYSPPVDAIPGDIDGDKSVTTNDVIQLLLHVTMPDMFAINVEADFDGDGLVTTEDVIQLLLHVTMPDMFPL